MTVKYGLEKNDLLIIKKIIGQNCPNAGKVALFGSRATGKHKPESDIDLVVYGHVTEQEIERAYTCFLESILPYKVDIVAYHHTINPALKQHIDKVAKSLFINHPI